MSIIDPIGIEDVTDIPEVYQRILLYNPFEVYERIYNQASPQFTRHEFSHYKRRNTLNMAVLFPKPKSKICSCGCGKKLTGRRTRWATDDCQLFAFTVHQVISGDPSTIRELFNIATGAERCVTCGVTDNDIPRKEYRPEYETDPDKREKLWNKEIKELANKIHVEHIVPVHRGGGGCWLGNYQLMCEDCHKRKTKLDRGNF